MDEQAPAGSGLLARNLALLVTVLVIWVLTFWPTFHDMAALWLRSETFAHGLVVLPISAYLVWRRRAVLDVVAAQPAWIMAIPLLLAVLAWGAGVAFSVASLEHLASTVVLVLSLWLCIGHRLFRAIAFPLGFLMFMAPVGDFLVPTLMNYTADFTVAALRATGVPVFQEGRNLVIPNGHWSVVEACSGIRYVIASLMVGFLYAYLNYRSMKRRAIFAVFALLVPIVANWLRAYMIVLLGYLSDNKLAVGVDHLLYGWVFFGLVIMVMFWIGNHWAEPDEIAPLPADVVAMVPGQARRVVPGVLAILVGLAVASWIGYGSRPVDSGIVLTVPKLVPADGWVPAAGATGFRPAFDGYRGELTGVYRRGDDEVDLYAALYADQAPGHEMVAWSNQLSPDRKIWRVVEESTETFDIGQLHYLRIDGPTGLINVWHWYRIGPLVEDDDYLATLKIVWRRLSQGDDHGAHVVIAVPGESTAAAREVAARFIAANDGAIGHAIDAAFRAKD